MFAVIKTGGKQYRVEKDDIIRVERLGGEVGDKIAFEDVLMLGGEGEAQVGAPLLDGAKVQAEVVEQGRGDKIIIFKKKRRKNHRRRNGHRQYETLLRVTDILAPGQKAPRKRAARKPKAEAEATEAEATAAETTEAAPAAAESGAEE